jgi:hypothetical protein
MVDEKPRLTASEIEEELLVELQKLPTLHDSIRYDSPVLGRKSFTWELDGIEPEVGPTQSKFVDVATVVVQLQQQYVSALRRQPEDDEAAKRDASAAHETNRRRKRCGALWSTW